MPATMSVLGLYRYDPTIFDKMELPDAISRETVIDNILLECAELEVLYTNPDSFKTFVNIWSRKEKPIWEKLYSTTQYDYNPINNYDRTETYTETETRNISETAKEERNLANSLNENTSAKGTSTEERDLKTETDEEQTGSRNTSISQSENVNIKNSGSDTDTKQVYGYNTTVGADSEKITSQKGTTQSSEKTVSNSETESTNNEIENKVKETGTIDRTNSNSGSVTQTSSDTGTVDRTGSNNATISHTHSVEAYGNIGVTTTQQMIEQERRISEFNIYDYIVNSFKNRFCILVW